MGLSGVRFGPWAQRFRIPVGGSKSLRVNSTLFFGLSSFCTGFGLRESYALGTAPTQ